MVAFWKNKRTRISVVILLIILGCKTTPVTQRQEADNKLDHEVTIAPVLEKPAETRFGKTILVNDLNEPMELAAAPDGRIFYIERAGKFFLYHPETKKTQLLHQFTFDEKALAALNGLLGIILDPHFSQNRHLYFFLTAPGGAPYQQQIARYTLNSDGTLDLASQKIILSFPIDVAGRTHTGGSMAWDKAGNLYISTGDNTNPSRSDGFAPIDERPGRLDFDAQRTASNTNDLRGKILRIHPEADGTYTIPKGNLFQPGLAKTRPEIYVMGTRNPYRISVDPETSILYWGEVGPDAGQAGEPGPRGYDELNQAKASGNFGWPYFVADNQAYKDFDFATKTIGAPFAINAPVNYSPNNTGLQTLPPAQKALIWYPYDASPEFPMLGTGGRSAMSGPVYHYNENLKSDKKLPAYYDKALFFFDWMRSWIFTVHLDVKQQLNRLEPFMPTRGQFIRPMDIEIGPDGALYMLEYGTGYSADNPDARLVRIDYNAGNQKPVAKLVASDTLGSAPLKVAFTSESFDYDKDDKLKYEWRVSNENKIVSSAPTLDFVFSKNGAYQVMLKVSDPARSSHTDSVTIRVGNTLPVVKITTPQNSSFFFPAATSLAYTVQVTDKEDKTIDPKKIKVKLHYLPKVVNPTQLTGDQQLEEASNLGKTLVANSDCQACHQVNKKVVGPAFKEVARKYQNDKGAVTRLADKIIKGGGGVWGDFAMNAHPQVSPENAAGMVKYVLSLAKEQPEVNLPPKGKLTLNQHVGKKEEGRYVITASYTDNGGALSPLTSTKTMVLRPARVQAEDAEILNKTNKVGSKVQVLQDKSYFAFKGLDLTGIKTFTYRFNTQTPTVALEVRTGSPDGPLISSLDFKTGTLNKYLELSAPLVNTTGKHNLYFVFRKDPADGQVFLLDYIEFKE